MGNNNQKLMKMAVIVVGSHHAGKSKTINMHFKPLINLPSSQRVFCKSNLYGTAPLGNIEEHYGYILSKSLEERSENNVFEVVERYKYFTKLVFAARPQEEKISVYFELKKSLEKVGFSVSTITIDPKKSDSFYNNKAKEILLSLQ